MLAPPAPLRRWRSQLGLRFHRWRMRHTRHVLRARDGSGFGLVESLRHAATTSRVYLGEDRLSELDIREAWRPGGEAAFGRRTAHRLGLHVLRPARCREP